MNILHLKYAVEVEKYHSINKAAEKLYMGQPNLSRAIKELEESLNIKIFKRTSKGMIPTTQGKEFLIYARNILAQIDEMEELYKNNGEKKQKFSICVPYSNYILNAFMAFIEEIDLKTKAEIMFEQTDIKTAVSNIVKSECNLAIVRYPLIVEDECTTLFTEKGIVYRGITEFKYQITVSKTSGLANLKTKLTRDDLNDYIEIVRPQQVGVSRTLHETLKEEFAGTSDKRVHLEGYESQLEFLSHVENAFMWAAPIHEDVLEKYNLVQISLVGNEVVYKDVLINKKDYKLSKYDNLFIDKLIQVKRELQLT